MHRSAADRRQAGAEGAGDEAGHDEPVERGPERDPVEGRRGKMMLHPAGNLAPIGASFPTRAREELRGFPARAGPPPTQPTGSVNSRCCCSHSIWVIAQQNPVS